MSDDLLQLRANAARAALEDHLDPEPPELGCVRRRTRSRRLGLLAAIMLAALAVGSVIVAVQSDPPAALVAGPSTSTGNGSTSTGNRDLLPPGTARRLPASPLAGRSTAASVWTGMEMLIWGGDGPDGPFDDGAAYNPRADRWRLLPIGPLSARNAPAAIWTGREMLLWGGHGEAGGGHSDGAAFDPASGTWRSIAGAPIRSAGRPVAVWTGSEMMVMAGFNGREAAAYNPSTNVWRELPSLPGQLQAPNPTAVWTGSQVVTVISSSPSQSPTIVALKPSEGGWAALPNLAGSQIRLAWTGDRLLASAGPTTALLDAENNWTPAVQTQAAVTMGDPVSVWTGTLLLLWSGEAAIAIDPIRRTWTTTPPGGRQQSVQPAAVWADGVFLAWGAFPDINEGVMLHPSMP